MPFDDILQNQERYFSRENVYNMFFYWHYDCLPDENGKFRPFLSFKMIPKEMVHLLKKTMAYIGVYHSDESILIPIFSKKECETEAKRFFSKNKKIKLSEANS